VGFLTLIIGSEGISLFRAGLRGQSLTALPLLRANRPPHCRITLFQLAKARNKSKRKKFI
jgi:hypothetical protein